MGRDREAGHYRASDPRRLRARKQPALPCGRLGWGWLQAGPRPILSNHGRGLLDVLANGRVSGGRAHRPFRRPPGSVDSETPLGD